MGGSQAWMICIGCLAFPAKVSWSQKGAVLINQLRMLVIFTAFHKATIPAFLEDKVLDSGVYRCAVLRVEL